MIRYSISCQYLSCFYSTIYPNLSLFYHVHEMALRFCICILSLRYSQGFKKRSRSRLGYVKVFAISVGTGVTTLIAVVAVWINHNLFFNIKTVIHSNGIVTCKNRFVAAVFTVADLYLKPCYKWHIYAIWDKLISGIQ
jgi:hypothetical protein